MKRTHFLVHSSSIVELFYYHVLCSILVLPTFFSSISMAEFINTSTDAVLCYSCMATPPLYANVNVTQLEDHLLTHSINRKTNRTITLPVLNNECRETHVTAQGQFLDTKKYLCDTGACVKLKGYFQGEAFVIRECWDRLWDRGRGGKWQGCAPLTFLTETETEMCVCSTDLCNGASVAGVVSVIIFLPILGIFVNSYLYR